MALQEYALQRRTLKQQLGQQKEDADTAVARRLAQQGLRGGAELGIMKDVNAESYKAGEQQFGNIRSAEGAEQARIDEDQKQRAFERVMQAQGEGFAKQQAQGGRDFQNQLFEQENDFNRNKFDNDLGFEKLKWANLSELDKDISEFNMKVGQFELAKYFKDQYADGRYGNIITEGNEIIDNVPSQLTPWAENPRKPLNYEEPNPFAGLPQAIDRKPSIAGEEQGGASPTAPQVFRNQLRPYEGESQPEYNDRLARFDDAYSRGIIGQDGIPNNVDRNDAALVALWQKWIQEGRMQPEGDDFVPTRQGLFNFQPRR